MTDEEESDKPEVSYWVRSRSDVEDKLDEVKEEERRFFSKTSKVDYNETESSLFEDFVVPTRSRITALKFYSYSDDEEYMAFSQYPDFYEFRTYRKVKNVWRLDSLGPYIDKKQDQVFICVCVKYF